MYEGATIGRGCRAGRGLPHASNVMLLLRGSYNDFHSTVSTEFLTASHASTGNLASFLWLFFWRRFLGSLFVMSLLQCYFAPHALRKILRLPSMSWGAMFSPFRVDMGGSPHHNLVLAFRQHAIRPPG